MPFEHGQGQYDVWRTAEHKGCRLVEKTRPTIKNMVAICIALHNRIENLNNLEQGRWQIDYFLSSRILFPPHKRFGSDQFLKVEFVQLRKMKRCASVSDPRK